MGHRQLSNYSEFDVDGVGEAQVEAKPRGEADADVGIETEEYDDEFEAAPDYDDEDFEVQTSFDLYVYFITFA